jgi:hypothetical protein
MIYTNTASILSNVIAELTGAIGDNPRVTAVLLTCSDQAARHRLARGERSLGEDLLAVPVKVFPGRWLRARR